MGFQITEDTTVTRLEIILLATQSRYLAALRQHTALPLWDFPAAWLYLTSSLTPLSDERIRRLFCYLRRGDDYLVQPCGTDKVGAENKMSVRIAQRQIRNTTNTRGLDDLKKIIALHCIVPAGVSHVCWWVLVMTIAIIAATLIYSYHQIMLWATYVKKRLN